MKIVVFCNNLVGLRIVRWLVEQGETIAALVMHPPEKRKFGPEIIAAAGKSEVEVLDGSRLDNEQIIDRLAALGPDLGVSVFFGYLLRPRLLDLFPAGAINLHPSYLPYNRGSYPNVWSIIDGTPAGATIHYLDEGVDTGDIIAQREEEQRPDDTGQSLYLRLEDCCLKLFKDTWPLIAKGDAPRSPQRRDRGSVHRMEEVERIDRIDLDETCSARQLIDILRARTFPPHSGAYFMHEGRRIYLRLQLDEEKSE